MNLSKFNGYKFKSNLGKFALSFYLQMFPFRVLSSSAVVILVFLTPMMIDGRFDDIPTYYKVVIMTIYFLHQVKIVSKLNFYSKFFIADFNSVHVCFKHEFFCTNLRSNNGWNVYNFVFWYYTFL